MTIIDKKLIHFNRKEVFEEKLANNEILDTSIVFVKDSKEIWTHSNSYKGVNWSTIPNLIVFTIDNVRCDAEDGMTWYEWCNSEYNTLGITCAGNSYDVYHSDGKRMVLTGLDEGVMGSNQIEKLDYRIGYGSGGGN